MSTSDSEGAESAPLVGPVDDAADIIAAVLIGHTLSHYRITAKLGAGGMGEVYRATDTKLGREVAIKVLPAEMADSEERLERFRREAQALAALDHPGIVTVYSVEEADGIHFLTMQLVEGEPLDQLISGGGIGAERILEIGTAVAAALAAAHEKGIVHRDLKPANIMVTGEGRVKVLDFGLAKISGPQSDTALETEMPTALLTRDGIVMGTVPYMSPEQVAGRALDARTDIFSLGVVLYEMAAGQLPFAGQSSAELASAILRDRPGSLIGRRRDLPPSLARVIERCLEKDPEARFATARELRDGLAGVTPVETSADATPTELFSAPPSSVEAAVDSAAARAREEFWLAVLPFKYKGDDTDLEALAEGLSEEIVTGLSRFSYLRVISRSSTERYSGGAGDVRSVGAELGASYVMEGSLRRAGSVLRVTVQLVDASTGAHLWAQTYDRSFGPDAVFEVQDELVPRIVSTVADMHGILPRRMSETVRLEAADELTPYEALLHSFGYNERFTPEALAEARACLERAVEQAPENADCWAMLSVMYSNEYGHWDNRDPDFSDKALAAARKAVQAAPLNSLPHYALAQALFFRREFPASRTAAERAVALNPMDGSTAAFMGLLIAYSGDWERGCALAEKGLELNPNLPGMYNYTAWHDAYRKKDYERALDLALKLDTPDNFYQHAVLAMCYAQLGEMDAARRSVQDMLALKPDYAKVARQLHGKWIQPDLVELLIDGLKKAGLEIADEGEQVEVEAKQETPATATHLTSGEQRADEGFWVAVLPFKYTGDNADVAALAEGLSEEIVTGLSRFSYLRVISRGSTRRYADEAIDVRAVGQELGARYVMEGSLRQAGSTLRIAAQLVDAVTGAHLWAESYKRPFDPEEIFEVQDDVAPRIVSTVADMNGVLPHSMSELLRHRDPASLSPYEAVLRGFGYLERIEPVEHADVRAALERAVEEAPDQADAWAMLSMMYAEEFKHDFNVQPEPLERALEAARRAVAIAPSNHLAYHMLAQAHFFRRELEAFRPAADRAVALNPMDGCTTAFMGILMAYAGDWERGCPLAERAMELNPHHPGWYRFSSYFDAYRRQDYSAALDVALKFNMPSYFYTHAAIAAAYGQLGERQAAQAALKELLAQKPDFAQVARQELAKWHGTGEVLEGWLDGLRKAGLEIPEASETASLASDAPASGTDSLQAPASGATRAEEGFWVAVLPFTYTGADADVTALAEGLTEEIVTGLSRFSYLRVISRSSTRRYADEVVDVRDAGREIGARYVMGGSLRQAGAQLRVAVQLVDVDSGAHLWAETYDRSFDRQQIFALQDELAPRIVSTVADMNGVLPRSMSAAVRSGDPGQLSPYEAVLRGFAYLERATPDELAAALSALEAAVEKAPAYADAWAMLAYLSGQDYGQGFKVLDDPLASGQAAARRAVELGPSNPLAYLGLAQLRFFQKEVAAFRNAAERAAALNPMDGNSIAFLGEMLIYTGDFERGLELATRAKQLNPNHPGWYWYADCYVAFRQGDDRGALEILEKVNLPGHWGLHAAKAACLGQLGESAAAAKSLRLLLDLRPDFAITGRVELEKWWEPDYVERFLDGLRKAGLER